MGLFFVAEPSNGFYAIENDCSTVTKSDSKNAKKQIRKNVYAHGFFLHVENSISSKCAIP